jgi:hypothetical protein
MLLSSYLPYSNSKKCFRAAQFAESGHRSDQQGTKETEPFRVGTAAQKSLNLLLPTKLLSFQHSVSGLLFPRPFFAGSARTYYLNIALSCTTPPWKKLQSQRRRCTNYLGHYKIFLLRFRVFLRPCFAYPTRTGRKRDTRLFACLHFFA